MRAEQSAGPPPNDPVPGGTSTSSGGESVVNRRGVLTGAAAYATWGLFPLYFHELGAVGAFELVCLRILATGLLAWVILSIRGETGAAIRVLRNRPMFFRVGLAALALSLNWFIYMFAVTSDRVIDAAIGYFVNPLVTVALGVVLLHERLRRLQLVSLALGASAVTVLTAAYGQFPWIALTIAASFGSYGYLKKTANLGTFTALAVEMLCLAPIGIIGLVAVSVHNGLDTPAAPGSTQLLLLLLGGVTALPLVLFGSATRRVPLSLIGLLQYITPTMQLLSGVWVFHEPVPTARWIGMACVWVALTVVLFDSLRAGHTARSGRPARNATRDTSRRRLSAPER